MYFLQSALLKLSSSLASSTHTSPLSSLEGTAHIVKERRNYQITVDFKRFPSLCQSFVPLRCSITGKSLYLAQLRGLKDILKPNCCKEFLCTAAHLCPLIEIPLFSGAVSAVGKWDLVQGMSSRGSRKDDNPVTIFFSWISYLLCLENKINNPCSERIHLSLEGTVSPWRMMPGVPGKLSHLSTFPGFCYCPL